MSDSSFVQKILGQTPKKTKPSPATTAVPLTLDELNEQIALLQAANADKDAEITRLGNLKPPPVLPPIVHTGNTGTIAKIPPYKGTTKAPKVQVKQNTGTKQAPPLPAAANVAAQQGGAMPPMPRMGNIIMNDRTWEAWTGGAPKLN